MRLTLPSRYCARFARSGEAGGSDGAGMNVRFYFLINIAIDQQPENISVSERGTIRKITPQGTLIFRFDISQLHNRFTTSHELTRQSGEL